MNTTLMLLRNLWCTYLGPYFRAAVIGMVSDFALFLALVGVGLAPFFANGFSAILAALIVSTLSFLQGTNRSGTSWGLRIVWLLFSVFAASVAVEFLAVEVGLAPSLAKVWVVPFSFLLNGFVFFRIGLRERIG